MGATFASSSSTRRPSSDESVGGLGDALRRRESAATEVALARGASAALESRPISTDELDSRARHQRLSSGERSYLLREMRSRTDELSSSSSEPSCLSGETSCPGAEVFRRAAHVIDPAAEPTLPSAEASVRMVQQDPNRRRVGITAWELVTHRSHPSPYWSNSSPAPAARRPHTSPSAPEWEHDVTRLRAEPARPRADFTANGPETTLPQDQATVHAA